MGPLKHEVVVQSLITTMGPLKHKVVVQSQKRIMVQLLNFTTVRIATKKFLHLYGFMLLSGNIESDNHNGAIEILDKCSDK